MEGIFSSKFQISSDEVDMFGRCCPAAMLSIFFNIADTHKEEAGVDSSFLFSNYHAVWHTARAWYQLYRPILVGEELTFVSSVRKPDSFVLYRDFDIFCKEEQVGQGILTSVAEDLESKKKLWLPSIKSLQTLTAAAFQKSKKLKLIQTPVDKAKIFSKEVRLSDLDMHGNLKNTTYAEIAFDVFTPDILKDCYISDFQLNYSTLIRYGTEIDVYSALTGGITYISGINREGTHCFDAAVIIQKTANAVEVSDEESS